MKRIISLDILKYISCFIVIIIHMDIPSSVETIIQPFLTTSVPVFFMITGYFYSETVRTGKVKKQIRKIAGLALAANMLHIGWCCFKYLFNRESILPFIAEIIEPESLLNLILFNQPIWRTSIWYINALLLVLIIFCLVYKQDDFQKSYILIPILLSCNLILGTYSFVLPMNEHILLCYSRNFLFCGIPYFLLGNYVFSNKKRLCNMFGKWQWVVLFWLLGRVEFYVLESLGVLRYSDHIISSLFLSLSLFCVFSKDNFSVSKLGEKISELGRKHSFVIYVIHSIVIELFYKMINKLSEIPVIVEVLVWVGPVLVLVVATLFAHLVTCCKYKLKSQK